ncbi:MAG TPA: methyltransferase domain-containing protein [Ardenticatenaceae bacterium]|nr:methyltransferase domain-containing protein [Ardenticatenaceae bacterium]
MRINYFEHGSAARRYARSRPYFHPLVVEKIKARLQLDGLLPWALDVACGTGQSTIALKAIAARIVGTDVSREMLAEAPRDRRIHYCQASAEALPLTSERFTLATVALAFHWFDRSRFLREAHRVLQPGAWLAVYNNGFYGEMLENPQFARWMRDEYLARYPSPPRHSQPLSDAEAESRGFAFVAQESYTNDVLFSVDELAAYLMTQSNVIAAAERGTENPETVYAWLTGALSALFPAARGTFRFGGPIWYLRKKHSC